MNKNSSSKNIDPYPFETAKVPVWQEKAVSYYENHGRKDLLWRETRDPWKILLSEMLLRKTTAVQASSAYKDLADIPLVVLGEWENKKLESLLKPLGIFRERARLLKAAASKVAAAGIDSMRDEEFLRTITGAGDYAVNTVLCFAFGLPRPALDRNMIRILERVFSIKSLKARPHTDRRLWKTAELLVPKDQAREYNWGILDLAAAVCRPANPKCQQCPFFEICDYGSKNINGEN